MEKLTMKPHEILAIAVEAEVDPKTVKRYLDGKPVRGRNLERIEKALAKAAKKGKTWRRNP
jgi:DNA-binding LacI/PurR family transcriptional regulator